MNINDTDSDWDQLEFLNELTVVEKTNSIIYLKEGFEFLSHNYNDYYKNILSLIGKDELNMIQYLIKKEEMNSNKNKTNI